ncbi:DUF4184 family protein [Fusibacter sp. JL216-2]|uniref:DUF4184 family protein n=1 Tax=Fusibacter sp. JL216-2 TaxID=3071453 RepID=UPI003D335559
MPFTPAHAVVSLPFVKRMRAISVFGLIIGSMAPDFEYFLRLKPASMGGHTIMGMFFLNLPICIVLAILYMNVLEDGLIQLLPSFLAKKWPRFGRNVRHYALAEWLNFIFWTLTGMLTHIGWDAFTHKTGAVVGLFPVLTNTVEIIGKEVPIYKLLQHTSTLIGLISIFIYIMLRQTRHRMPQAVEGLGLIRLIFFIILGSLALVRYLIFSSPAVTAYGEWIVSLMTYAFIAWLVTSFIIKKRERQAVQEFLAN